MATAKKLPWTHDEKITAEEFIIRIEPLICGPVRTMNECEGDMWLSDYRQLMEAFWKIQNAVTALKGKE